MRRCVHVAIEVLVRVADGTVSTASNYKSPTSLFNTPRPENGQIFADDIFVMKGIVAWVKFHWRVFSLVRMTLTHHGPM